MWPRAPSPSALLMLLLWQPVTVTLVPPASNNQPGWKCRCANQSLCTPLSSIPARREIFAYYEDHWSEGSYNQSWHDLFSGGTVTTIAVCEGHAVQEPGLATARMSDEHLCFAHAHNVRVVPGCVGCDVWSGAPDALSRCPVRRALPPLLRRRPAVAQLTRAVFAVTGPYKPDQVQFQRRCRARRLRAELVRAGARLRLRWAVARHGGRYPQQPGGWAHCPRAGVPARARAGGAAILRHRVSAAGTLCELAVSILESVHID
jgi:hypothetical protein